MSSFIPPQIYAFCSIRGFKRPLPDEVKSTLYMLAFEMLRGGETVLRLDGNGYAGKLTNLERGSTMGAKHGILFQAELDSDSGSGMVTFLVNPNHFLPYEHHEWQETHFPWDL